MRANIRTDRPTPARMYDYYLGGKDNFAVDRAAVEAMRPEVTELLRNTAWENPLVHLDTFGGMARKG